jgi:hypothetical protein
MSSSNAARHSALPRRIGAARMLRSSVPGLAKSRMKSDPIFAREIQTHEEGI